MCLPMKQCKVLEFASKTLVEIRHYTSCCSTVLCTNYRISSVLIVYMSELITVQQPSFQRKTKQLRNETSKTETHIITNM